MAKEIDQNPARDVIVDPGSRELLTLRMTTDPFPVPATGTVTLNFIPMDSRQRAVELDVINYEYGKAGNNQTIGSGMTQIMPGSGMYMFTGSAQLPSAGSWWIRARIIKGKVKADANFTISVKPAKVTLWAKIPFCSIIQRKGLSQENSPIL